MNVNLDLAMRWFCVTLQYDKNMISVFLKKLFFFEG